MTALPKGIRQRGASFLVDVTMNGERRTATCATLAEAIEKRGQIHAALITGKPAETRQRSSWTLQEAFDHTLATVWKGTRGEDTAALNAGLLIEHFGKDKRLDAIGPAEWGGFVKVCQDRGNSDATINRKLACLTKMMREAVDAGRLAAVPKLKRRKEAVGRIRFLTPAEEALFLATLRQWEKHEEADAVELLVDTGLRYGELLRLTRRDVDLREGILHVWTTKADLPRSVPLTRRARAVVERRLARPGDRLFPYEKHWLRYSWDRAKTHLGWGEDDQLVIHALRHTCASRLVQRGVALAVVQEWLGHRSILQTRRYAHLSPANLKSAVAALEPLDMAAAAE